MKTIFPFACIHLQGSTPWESILKAWETQGPHPLLILLKSTPAPTWVDATSAFFSSSRWQERRVAVLSHSEQEMRELGFKGIYHSWLCIFNGCIIEIWFTCHTISLVCPFKCANQWFSVYSQSCATISTVSFRSHERSPMCTGSCSLWPDPHPTGNRW